MCCENSNSEASIGSKIWCSLQMAKMLMECIDHNFFKHSMTSSILVLTSLQKEGKGLNDVLEGSMQEMDFLTFRP
jgi:hypothetical protein